MSTPVTHSPATRGGYRASTAIGLVAKRELRESLVKKGSVVTLILGIVLAIGGVLLTAYLTRDDGEAAEPTTIAVVGEAPFVDALAQAPEGATPTPIESRPAASADEARALLDDGTVDAALVPATPDGGEPAGPNEWTLLQDGAPDTLAPTLNAALAQKLQSEAIAEQGGDPAAVAAARAGVRAADPTLILYTSGTTSRPRGCVLDHAALVAEGEAVAERLGLGPGDRFWTPLPMYHCGGYDVAVAALAGGCGMVHTGVFEPGAALRQLAAERCTVAFPAFETIWLPVLDHPDFPTTDLSALRIVLNVGAPERLRSMQERIAPAIQMSSYGMTESCGFCCIGAPDDPPEARATTSGKPLRHMEIRVVDPETGRPVPAGTPGEVQFRGTSRVAHYHRDPELTTERIDAGGWFASGDLAVADAHGRISFRSRRGDMLKVGGENVAAAEVEGFLGEHPACGVVQVVAAPDARLGEVPAAFVQLQPGASTTEQELIDYCLGTIATFKVPRYVRFVAEWPMSGTKVQKFRLRRRIAAELAEAGITEAPRLTSRGTPAGMPSAATAPAAPSGS